MTLVQHVRTGQKRGFCHHLRVIGGKKAALA